MNNDNLEFGRLITAIVTPFNKDLEIDFKAYANLIEHLIQTGTQSILVCGTTGESPTLSDTEKLELLKFTLKQVKNRAKVIFGSGTNDTRKSIELSGQAEKLGADGLLIVAPYYNKPSTEGLYVHFEAIANSVKLPIIIYNIPARTGVTVEYDTVERLTFNCANVFYVKDASGSIKQCSQIGGLDFKKFKIYSGDDDLTYQFLCFGGVGVISVASHLVGEEITNLIDCFFARDLKSALNIHYNIAKLIKGLFLESNPVGVKYALYRMGLIKPYVRPPLIKLSYPVQGIIDSALGELSAFNVIPQGLEKKFCDTEN